ncbi:MAG: restriction endonuclease subunit S [Candidatus Thiodiazotropha endolucinida]
MEYQSYPNYKRSSIDWLHEIPEHWDETVISALFEDNKHKNKGNVEQNLLSLSYGRIIKKDINTEEGLLPASFETYQIVNSDHIVLRLTDLQNDQRSLRVGHVCEKGIITSAYTGLKKKSFRISSARYFYYLLHAYDLMKVFYGMGAGVRQSLGFDELKKIRLLLPNDEEQEHIVQFLDHETTRIDALIEKKQRLIELLKEKRQVVITQAVTKGLDPNVPMKDSGVEWLGEVPAHWSIAKLRWLASLQGGVAKGKVISEKDAVTLPYLRVANVQDGYVDLTEVKKIEVLKSESKRYLLRASDVLMNEGGDNDKLGRGTVWAGEIEPCIHQNHVFAIRTEHRLLPEFLALYTRSHSAKAHFFLRSKQSTNLASISASNIMETSIPVPPLDEQHTILMYVDETITRLNLLETKTTKSIELLKKHRSALITAAVTGQIDVRNIA